MDTLLEIENLSVVFRTEDEVVHAVRDFSLSVRRGTTHGIVGESGSGKSVSCQAILGLTPGNGQFSSDRMLFDGRDLKGLRETELEKIRGCDMAMVFQDPMASLNPVHKIGRQIGEGLRMHRGMNRRQSLIEARHLLERVGIPEPEKRLREYPHQLSGGMCQRAMIAMALACRPSLLFADEPTTALDVTVQAQVLDLMKRLQTEFNMTIVLITHDLGVIAEMADDVTVMRQGRVIETGPVERIFKAPEHPYTRELLDRIPRLENPSPIYTPPSMELRQ